MKAVKKIFYCFWCRKRTKHFVTGITKRCLRCMTLEDNTFKGGSFEEFERGIMGKEDLVPKRGNEIIINRSEIRQSGEDGFGMALVSAAKDSYNDERKLKAIAAVKHLMRVRDRALAMVVRWNEVAEFNKQKIDALESGEFEYEIATGCLTFKDERLDIQWETPVGI